MRLIVYVVGLSLIKPRKIQFTMHLMYMCIPGDSRNRSISYILLLLQKNRSSLVYSMIYIIPIKEYMTITNIKKSSSVYLG